MVDITVFRGSEGGKIKKGTTSKELGPHDVLIKITHSGLCFTDVHYKGSGIVLGHEGTGTVENIGAEVTQFKVGQRAGFGYNHNCCGHCKQCEQGRDTLCAERELYGFSNQDQGSFASHAVWNENFVFAIPDELTNNSAAPLMCSGATVFSALYRHGLRSSDRVGVIGVGGLGHLAIQFARAMGCTVVVFSGSDSKRDEAIKLGASEFYAMKGQTADSVTKLACELVDHLVVTSSELPDWNLYLPLLAPGATIYPLTVSQGDLTIPAMGVIANELKIQGSLVADRNTHKAMLVFAARHGIKPMINEYKMTEEGIEEAFRALEGGRVKYRGVLVAQ